MEIADIWHSVEDKAWSLADFLEDKGIPIATFCEDKGLSPTMLFGGILVLIVLLLVLSGAGVGGGTGMLEVVAEDGGGNPLSLFQVEIVLPGGVSRTTTTNDDGVAKFLEVPFGEVLVNAKSPGYTGKVVIDFNEDGKRVRLIAQAEIANLQVIVQSTDGGYLDSGTIEIRDIATNTIKKTTTIDGSATYEHELEVGVYTVAVKSSSGGTLESRQVQLTGASATETFIISADSVNSALVKVIVKDENGNAVKDAVVTLYNFRSDSIISEQVTDAKGETVFQEGVAMGTAVYAMAYVPGDMRYSIITKNDAKAKFAKTVDAAISEITITMELKGRVKVIVWDAESFSSIRGASVTIKDRAGTVISEVKLTDDQGEALFTGFEQNIEVYASVKMDGYLEYDKPAESKKVEYTKEYIELPVALERDGSFIESRISIAVMDIYRDPLGQVSGILSSNEFKELILALRESDNLTFSVDANKMYDVGIHKAAYLRSLLQGISAGSHDAELTLSTDDNSAVLEVCLFAITNGLPADASGTVELRDYGGVLLDTQDTGDDNCAVFPDIPSSWNVFVNAYSDGYGSAETGLIKLLPIRAGTTRVNVTLGEIIPGAYPTGNVKVCVKDRSNDVIEGASVILHDVETDGPTSLAVVEQFTGSDGCTVFQSVPAQRAGLVGTVPVRVYAIVSAPEFAIYNGNLIGIVTEVRANEETPINVRLGAGEEICFVVQGPEGPIADADVSLCADEGCELLLQTLKTEADGHVIFYTDLNTIFARAVVDEDGLQKSVVKNFLKSEVINGQCGTVNVGEVSAYTYVSLDGIPEEGFYVKPGSSSEITFQLILNDRPVTGGAIPSGTENRVLDTSGVEMIITLLGVEAGAIRTVDAGSGKYAIPFAAPEDEGEAIATLTVVIADCDTCQGDAKSVRIIVTNSDSDGDGVPNEVDYCPNTAEGVIVDDWGCPSTADSDGDGVPDNRDLCPNSVTGAVVDSDGCAIGVADRDGDLWPDLIDAYPVDSARSAIIAMDDDQDGLLNSFDLYINDPNSGGESSVMVCAVDEDDQPIYAANIVAYEHSTYYNTQSGQSGYYAGTSPAGTYIGTGGGTYANQYSQGTQVAASGSGQGSYTSFYYGGQSSWDDTMRTDNCRIFQSSSNLGYSSSSSFFSQFFVRVSATGYTGYDSRTQGSSNVRFSRLQNGMIRIDVVLRKGATPTTGEGTTVNPERTVQLTGDNEEWKAESGTGSRINLYPVVTLDAKEIQVQTEITLQSPANAELDYLLTYRVGNPCYEVEADESGRLEKDIHFRRGQRSVVDEITIYSDRGDCWEKNNPNLEGVVSLVVEGKLLQVDDQEVQAGQSFNPATVSIQPLVGAVEKVDSVKDLRLLMGKMDLAHGVVTLGKIPSCIAPEANTAKSSVAGSSLGAVGDESKAAYKVVLDFNKAFPTELEKMVGSIRQVLLGQKRTPLDCKAYVSVDDKYMGYVQVGQSGLVCAEAMTKQAPQMTPAEKLFCDTVETGGREEISLNDQFSLRTKET